MPRARLITRSTEASQEVLQLLRARGFEVEIVSPDDQSAQPADLEIKIEEYTVEEALDRAEQMPHAADLCAFVAPGTLSAGERVIAIPLLPDTAEDVGLVVERQQFATDADAPHSTFNAALAHASAETGFVFESDFERESANQTQEQPKEVPRSITMPPAMPVLATVAMPKADSVQNLSAQEPAAVIVPPDLPTTRREVAAWFSPAHLAFSSLRGRAKSWLDLAVMRSAFSALPSQRYRTRTMTDASFWKAATVIAAMAIFALLVGASARRAPLLANLTQSSQVSQKAPFAGARVRSISSTRSASGQVNGEPRAEQLRSSKVSEIMDEILSEPRPSASPSTPRISARSARRRLSRTRHEGNLVADDVVIYYDKKPVPPPAPPVVQDGIKHYSDLR
jgi:hypothetical protein